MAIFSAIATAVSSAIGAIGSGVGSALSGIAGVAGTALNFIGSQRAAKASERAEALRQRQMNLQATRERRQTIRQANVARAQALNQATAQNAGSGSGIAGGVAQIQGQAASNVQGINQGQEIGNQIFDANRDIARGQRLQGIGQAVQGFGNSIASNFEQNRRTWGWGQQIPA